MIYKHAQGKTLKTIHSTHKFKRSLRFKRHLQIPKAKLTCFIYFYSYIVPKLYIELIFGYNRVVSNRMLFQREFNKNLMEGDTLF